MRAIIQDGYGPPERLRVSHDHPDPAPGRGRILVRVRAVSLNGSDRENLLGHPLYARVAGIRRPRNPIPGSDVAGTVAAVGSGVTAFAVGDDVLGELRGYRGGLAELVDTTPETFTRKPADLSFVEAAALPQSGCISLAAVRGLQPGQHLLVNGAGGATGAFLIGLASHLGAEVTAADRADKADHLRGLGAAQTIDCDREDWADGRGRYDRIIDLIADRSPRRVHPALRSGGVYRMVGGRTDLLIRLLLAGPVLRATTGKQVGVLTVRQSGIDLAEVVSLVVAGHVRVGIDSVVPFEDASTAFERLARGDHRGKIVIEVA